MNTSDNRRRWEHFLRPLNNKVDSIFESILALKAQPNRASQSCHIPVAKWKFY